MAEKKGTFYGIGVGPGDPDLIPVKSVKILQRAHTIYTASSTKNPHSQAVNIARPHIPDSARVIHLSFPMTSDISEKEDAWEKNARAVVNTINEGKDAVFLTLGDSMTYSTFGYIMKHVRKIDPEINIESIPGITSYSAAAARMNTPLVEGEESLMVISGARGGDHLRDRMKVAENVVILKAYKKAGDIVKAVDEAGLMNNSFALVNCGLPNEEVHRDIRELKKKPPGYWTLVFAKKGEQKEQ